MLLLEEAIYKSNPFTDYAIEHGLNQWDHYYFFLSLFLTILTLTISSIALVVSCKTLKSQKQTEQNTSPDITPKIQLSLFNSFVTHFSTVVFYLIRYYHFEIDKKDFKASGYDLDLYWNYNPNDYLFERVFYNDIEKFNSFISFIDNSKRLRRHLDRIKTLKDNKKTKEEIQKMFSDISICVSSVSCQILVVSKSVFNLSDSEILHNFINFFGNQGEFDRNNDLRKWIENDVTLEEKILDEKLANLKNKNSTIEKRLDISKELKKTMDEFAIRLTMCLLNMIYRNNRNNPFRNLQEIIIEEIKASFLTNLDFVINPDAYRYETKTDC